jgi:CubicO group peptidase (beta-lactamase class C family)
MYFLLIAMVWLPILLCQGQTQKAELELRTLMTELKAVGLSVVVVKKNDIIYKQHFGMQDIAKQKRLNDSSLFRIASISKSFSATAIMKLVEAKKVKLEDDFSNLVGFKIRNPNFPNIPITLKMVMSHTSSINDSQGYFNLDVINPQTNPNWAKCYSNYRPGTHYDYCNLNYNMVGATLERLTGERFDKHIKNKILTPLGLYGGYWVNELDSTRFATLYDYDSIKATFLASPQAYAKPKPEKINNYTLGYTTPVFSPTGGMKIGAVDLAKYMTMHMNYGSYNGVKIMRKKSAKRLQRKISEEEGYGMAIRSANELIPGKKLKGHTGSAYGLYSALFFDPKEKFGFVVITNGCLPDNKHDIRDILSRTIVILYNNFIKEK